MCHNLNLLQLRLQLQKKQNRSLVPLNFCLMACKIFSMTIICFRSLNLIKLIKDNLDILLA